MTVTTFSERVFADANIWLYALMERQDPRKYGIAKPITESAEIVASIQVINEVCVNLIKKAKFDEPKIQKVVSSFYFECEIIGIYETTVRKSSDLRGRYSFSYVR